MIKAKGIIYYDNATNKFTQIRHITEQIAICSGPCNYYSDAKTTNSEAPVSHDYINKHFVEVDFFGVDKFAEFDGIGWRVKK